METQKWGHVPRSGLEVKNGESNANDGMPKRLRCDNPRIGELDHAEGVRKRCKKNSSSVISSIGNKTREGCDRYSEGGTVDSG